MLDSIYHVFLLLVLINSRCQCASANTQSTVLQLAQPSLHHISYTVSNCKNLATRTSTHAAEMSKTEVFKSKLKTWSPRHPCFTHVSCLCVGQGETSTCSSMFMLGAVWGANNEWVSGLVYFGAFPISLPLLFFHFRLWVCQRVTTSFDPDPLHHS